MAWGLLRNLAALLLIFAAGAPFIRAQIESANPGARITGAARVEHGPRMDGSLDDPIWQQYFRYFAAILS